MATLHVRNVPDDLYEQIRRQAEAERRSLGAEVVTLLQRATGAQAEPYPAFLERIRRDREQLERQVGTLSSSVDLIREDRAR